MFVIEISPVDLEINKESSNARSEKASLLHGKMHTTLNWTVNYQTGENIHSMNVSTSGD